MLGVGCWDMAFFFLVGINDDGMMNSKCSGCEFFFCLWVIV